MAALLYLVLSNDALTLHDGAIRLHHLGADVKAAQASFDSVHREAEDTALKGSGCIRKKVLVELLEVTAPFTSFYGFVTFYQFSDPPEGVKVLASNNNNFCCHTVTTTPCYSPGSTSASRPCP